MIIHFRLLFLLLLPGLSAEMCAQELSHQVLVPMADIASTGVISYSQTIGETAIEIIEGEDYILTQGFQQPGIQLVDIIRPPGNGVDVYPNPASDNIKVKLFGDVPRDFQIDLITIAGTVVFTEKLSFTDIYFLEKVIPVSSLNSGIYFIRIVSGDMVVNRTFKIEKM